MVQVTRRRVVRMSMQARTERADALAVEEPLELRLDGESYTITMRTPGHDLELALGFLVAEGVIVHPGDVTGAMACPDAQDGNAVEVGLAPGVTRPSASRRRQISSACGLCGTTSIDEVQARSQWPVADDQVRVPLSVLLDLPDALRARQRGFDRTGGLHAAGLFDVQGTLLCLREDVGRHNAVDKVIGWAFERGLLPLSSMVLQVSGRASFELVQKASAAGCPVLSAVSAPSSLAADLADRVGLTLVGFNRAGSAVVYSRPERITGS